MAERIALIVLLVGLGLLALLRSPRTAPTPPRLPPGQAQLWMADALPSVGPKTRAEVLEAIRTGDLDALPSRARVVAEQVFFFRER